jgi:hypothetical protein
MVGGCTIRSRYIYLLVASSRVSKETTSCLFLHISSLGHCEGPLRDLCLPAVFRVSGSLREAAVNRLERGPRRVRSLSLFFEYRNDNKKAAFLRREA